MLRSVDQPRLGLWLIGLMWVLPFLSFRHLLPIPSFYGELVAAALGVAAMMVLLRKEVWQPFELPFVALLPLGLLGLILLQFPFGKIVFAQQALLGMLYLLWAMMLMVVGGQLRQALGWERFALTLSWFLMAGGVLSAVITVLQFAGWHGVLLVPRKLAQGYGNLGQANHFADYMALALASLIYLRAKGRITGPVLVGVASLFLGLLALSGSRSSWLYLLAMTMLAGMLIRAGSQRRLFIECLLLLPAFLFMQQIMPWLVNLSGGVSAAMPTDRLFQEVSGLGLRLQLWHQAWLMFISAPWLGVGFGQFDWNCFLLVDRMTGDFVEPAEHAHNLVLHLLAELGVFAGLLCVGMLLRWLIRAAKWEVSLEWWWMMALLAVIGIHSLLEYPLWYTYFLGVAAVLLGAGERRLLPLALERVGRPALAAMIVLGGIGLTSLGQAYATLEGLMLRSTQGQIKDIDLADVSRELMQVHNESLLSPYVELVLAASIEPTSNMLEEKLLLSSAAMQFSPIRSIVYRHALLLALKGDREAALLQLRRAMRAYPREIPQFQRELRQIEANSPGTYDFLLNEVAVQKKESSE